MENRRGTIAFARDKVMRTLSSRLALRASTIKLKINGLCVNKCSFCLFNNDPRLLRLEDIAKFFDSIRNVPFYAITVNGGEPTLHPQFEGICHFLKDRFKGRVHLSLGTNLIPISRESRKWRSAYRTTLETYDRIEVGCDDEHKNIHFLERLAPAIVSTGIRLHVNVVAAYCSPATKERILSLKKRFSFKVTFSGIHHHYRSCPKINDVKLPCRNRVRDFLLNCNGDAFFCFHQEMEKPVFNLFNVTEKQLNSYMTQYLPDTYLFCSSCPVYQPIGRLDFLKDRAFMHVDRFHALRRKIGDWQFASDKTKVL